MLGVNESEGILYGRYEKIEADVAGDEFPWICRFCHGSHNGNRANLFVAWPNKFAYKVKSLLPVNGSASFSFCFLIGCPLCDKSQDRFSVVAPVGF